jgi:hypothetical protein
MSWLRVDDKFAQHPKVLALTDREFRAHVATLCYCAEYRTDGIVPTSAFRQLGVTSRMAGRFVEVGVWDEEDGVFCVHNFRKFNPVDPTSPDRKKRWKERQRNGAGTETERSEERSSRAGTRARSRTRTPSTATETSSVAAEIVPLNPGNANSQQLVAEFVDACHDTGIEAPRRVIGQIAQATHKLLNEGTTPRRYPCRLPPHDPTRHRPTHTPPQLRRRSLNPQRPPTTTANGGMTPAQILEATRGKP